MKKIFYFSCIVVFLTGFNNNKKLPCPMKHGIFSKKSIKNLNEENNKPIFIKSENPNVYSFHNSKVFEIDSINNEFSIVFIAYKNLILIYSNLEKVFVQKNQKLKSNSIIGIAKNNKLELDVYDKSSEKQMKEFEKLFDCKCN